MVNTWVLAIFAPLLVLVGVLGFLQHGEGNTSNAPAYNIFHLTFGVIGLAVVILGGHRAISVFIIGFGLIDLYQAIASRMDWFPVHLFQWKPADDLLHVIIGIGLVAVGVLA